MTKKNQKPYYQGYNGTQMLVLWLCDFISALSNSFKRSLYSFGKPSEYIYIYTTFRLVGYRKYKITQNGCPQ